MALTKPTLTVDGDIPTTTMGVTQEPREGRVDVNGSVATEGKV